MRAGGVNSVAQQQQSDAALWRHRDQLVALEKALKVQRAARMVENYATAQPDIDHLIFRYSKMVLGSATGNAGSCAPASRCWRRTHRFCCACSRPRISRASNPRSPTAMAGSLRNDEIVALGSENEYTASISRRWHAFVRQAQRCKDKQVDVGYNQRVQHQAPGRRVRRRDRHQASRRVRSSSAPAAQPETRARPGLWAPFRSCPWRAANISHRRCLRGTRCTRCRTISCRSPRSTATRTSWSRARRVGDRPRSCCRCSNATTGRRSGFHARVPLRSPRSGMCCTTCSRSPISAITC